MWSEDSSSKEVRHVHPLDHPWCKATQPRNLEVFLRNLHELLPQGSFLFLEGVVIDPDLRTYLASHQPPGCPAVELTTIHCSAHSPPGYHIPVREEVLAVIADFSRMWYETGAVTPGLENDPYAAQAQVCDHIKAYVDDREIMVWYDVGSPGAWLYFADCITESALLAFCGRVGCEVEEISAGGGIAP